MGSMRCKVISAARNVVSLACASCHSAWPSCTWMKTRLPLDYGPCCTNSTCVFCVQTGSGKTAAFCFPIIASMLLHNYQSQNRNNRKATPFALILAPTRELTCQIFDEARKFTHNTGIRAVVIYGGAPVVNQVRLDS